jgi:hypothetical protein
MNWLKNFKPKMIIWDENLSGLPEGRTIYVWPVCASRVPKIRYRVAVKRAGNDENALKLLRGSDER